MFAFHEAISDGNVARVSEILRDDPVLAKTPDRQGIAPIHLLNTCDADTILDLLIDHGAVVTARTRTDLTPLHMVIDPDASRKLIAYGADIDATDKRGCTPLMTLVEQPQHALPAVNVLIEAGVDLNTQDQTKRTALSIARSKDAHALVDVLIAAGAQS